MPYICLEARNRLDVPGEVPENVGELTYAYTKAILDNAVNWSRAMELLRKITDDWIEAQGVGFRTFAEVLGALTATEMEFARRARRPMGMPRTAANDFLRLFYAETVAPYEDRKIAENGDVYPCESLD